MLSFLRPSVLSETLSELLFAKEVSEIPPSPWSVSGAKRINFFSLFFHKVRIVQRNNFFLWLLWIVLITLTAYFVFYFDSLKHLRSKFTVSEASDFVLEFSDHALEHLLQTLLV